MRPKDPSRRFATRLHLALLLDRLSGAAVAACFAIGTWVLATRIFFPAWAWMTGPVVLSGLLAAVLCGAALALRARWREDEVAAYADWKSGAGGLLVTLRERPDPRWADPLKERMRGAPMPRARLVPVANRLWPALLFACLAFLIPEKQPAWKAQIARAGKGTLQSVQERAEALNEQKLLSKEEEQKVREEIGRIEEAIEKGNFGAQDWEALDSLRRKLDEKAARAIDRMTRAAEALADAERGLGELAEGLDPESIQENERLAELSRAMEELAKSGLGNLLPEGMTPEELRELAGRLAQNAANAGQPLDPAALARQLAAVRDFLERRALEAGGG